MAFTRPMDGLTPEYPEFCTIVNPPEDPTRVEKPLLAKREIGWVEEEAPPRNWFNWLHSMYYKWIGYLDEFTKEIEFNLGGTDRRLTGVENITIPAIQGDVTALDGRLDTAESGINTLDGRVDGHDTDISTLDGRIDTIENYYGVDKTVTKAIVFDGYSANWTFTKFKNGIVRVDFGRMTMTSASSIFTYNFGTGLADVIPASDVWLPAVLFTAGGEMAGVIKILPATTVIAVLSAVGTPINFTKLHNGVAYYDSTY